MRTRECCLKIKASNSVLDAKYLYLALNRAKDHLAQLMKGSVYVTLKLTDLADYEIPLPRISDQKELGRQYEALLTLIAHNNQVVSEMEETIRSAMTKLWGEEE